MVIEIFKKVTFTDQIKSIKQVKNPQHFVKEKRVMAISQWINKLLRYWEKKIASKLI